MTGGKADAAGHDDALATISTVQGDGVLPVITDAVHSCILTRPVLGIPP